MLLSMHQKAKLFIVSTDVIESMSNNKTKLDENDQSLNEIANKFIYFYIAIPNGCDVAIKEVEDLVKQLENYRSHFNYEMNQLDSISEQYPPQLSNNQLPVYLFFLSNRHKKKNTHLTKSYKYISDNIDKDFTAESEENFVTALLAYMQEDLSKKDMVELIFMFSHIFSDKNEGTISNNPLV